MTSSASPGRLVLISASPRVAPGVLSWPAWEALRSGHVYTADRKHPQLPFLTAAGIAVDVLAPADDGEHRRISYLAGDGADQRDLALAHAFRERARAGETAVWLTGPEGDGDFVRALGDLVAREGGVEMEIVYASYDVPGARLLDLVSTMDRLRSPGGCPWDAEQTHESLAHYLVEETYEALDAIDAGDYRHLRDELGDVLLQVVFHARIAQERGDATAWTIDDVARGIVDKLVRRHPHVFGDVVVSGADEVVTNWRRLKDAEHGGRRPATSGVASGAPALALSAKLQQRATEFGLPSDLVVTPLAGAETLAQAVATLAAVADGGDPADRVTALGELLFAAVAFARSHNVDAESALRGVARAFRDRLATLDRLVAQGDVPRDAAEWADLWAQAATNPFAGEDRDDVAASEPDGEPSDALSDEQLERRHHAP
ncbi:MAG: YabN family protein [Mycobacteriales bacterium]